MTIYTKLSLDNFCINCLPTCNTTFIWSIIVTMCKSHPWSWLRYTMRLVGGNLAPLLNALWLQWKSRHLRQLSSTYSIPVRAALWTITQALDSVYIVISALTTALWRFLPKNIPLSLGWVFYRANKNFFQRDLFPWWLEIHRHVLLLSYFATHRWGKFRKRIY